MTETLAYIRDNSRFVTLAVTHNCNLNCSYCYEQHKDGCSMQLDTAIEIVERELNLEDEYTKVEFDFFGGEPLIEYQLIHDVIEHVKKHSYRKDCHFGISTNGTLLSQDMKEWFKANTFIITLGLSLDGTKKSHDINRSNSFDSIDLKFFSETYPEQMVKMTVSKETLGNLEEDVIFCHENGFKVACNLAYGIDWSNHHNKELLFNQLKKLIDYYVSNEGIEPCSMLDIERLVNVSSEFDKIYRTCGVGWSMRAYDTDGSVYPCQHFLPLSVGTEKARKSLSIVFEKEITNDSKLDARCKNCILVNSCPNCYGYNYAATGDIYKFDENLCNLIKMEYKACAYFASVLFEKGRIDMNYKYALGIIRGALEVNNNLVID